MPKHTVMEPTRINRRELFDGEATDFTPWLARKGLAQLGEKLDLELELLEIEASAGSRSCDILAEIPGTDQRVAIENMYNMSDPHHAWRLLEYTTLLGCDHGVLLAERIHDGQLQTFQALNASNPRFNFHLVEFTCYRLGDEHFVDFDVKLRPSDFDRHTQELRESKGPASTRGNKWRIFLDDHEMNTTTAGGLVVSVLRALEGINQLEEGLSRLRGVRLTKGGGWSGPLVTTCPVEGDESRYTAGKLYGEDHILHCIKEQAPGLVDRISGLMGDALRGLVELQVKKVG